MHCHFFVVPGNGPTLLEMSDCERLQLVSVHCHTIDAGQQKRQVKKQSIQRQLKFNPLHANKTNQEIDHFNAGPDKETDMAGCAKITKEMIDDVLL